MKKVFVNLSIVMILLLTITGCVNNSNEISNSSVVKNYEEADSTMVKMEVAKGEKDDEYSVLRTNDEIIECLLEKGEGDGFYLQRGNQKYHLSMSYPRLNGIDYNCGWFTDDGKVDFYIMYNRSSDSDYFLYSMGDVIVPKINPLEEKLLGYGKFASPNLVVQKLEYLGVTMPVHTGNQGQSLMIESLENSPVVRAFNISFSGVDITVFDKNGNEVEDWYYYDNVKADEIYKVGWYEGTKYNETEMCFSTRVYVAHDNPINYVPFVEGEPTEEGYFLYDLSSLALAPGFYSINGFVVEIIGG